MKKFKILQFKPQADEPLKQRETFEISPDLLKYKDGLALPCACIVSEQNATDLLEFRTAVEDRHTKHKAKSLSQLLTGYSKIPVIQGDYGNTGQLKRSIRTFLQNAIAQREKNLYFIGVSDDIFQELWSEAGDKPAVSADSDKPGKVPTDLVRHYLGNSPQVQKVRELIMLSAGNSEPVLILGETGTGKEIIAQSIHRYSRPGKPLQAINCGAIPAELLELTLVGYVKGAHHLALMDTKGVWEEAGEGTIFLDEVGDLALNHQVKILRALQEGKIRRIGSNSELPVNARVIAATNVNLGKAVRTGNFRADLLSRLDVIAVQAPPLREHPEDIPLIAQIRWEEITGGLRPPLGEAVLSELKAYTWPGNVRELENIIKKLHYLNPSDERITIRHLRDIIKNSDLKIQLDQLASRNQDSFIDLWVEHRTRDFAPESRGFYIGDPVQICVKAKRECELLLVDVGTSGDISIIPSNPASNNRVQPDEEIRIPGTLKGNAGNETFFAIAATAPLNFKPDLSTESSIQKLIDQIENYNSKHPQDKIALKSISFEINQQ